MLKVGCKYKIKPITVALHHNRGELPEGEYLITNYLNGGFKVEGNPDALWDESLYDFIELIPLKLKETIINRYYEKSPEEVCINVPLNLYRIIVTFTAQQPQSEMAKFIYDSLIHLLPSS